MKKTLNISILAVVVSLMILPAAAKAQGQVEISPFGGYMFGGSLKMYEGKFKVNDAANYGIAMDFRLARDSQIELMWTQMSTTAQFQPYYGYADLGTNVFDMNVGYIQIGGIQEMDLDNIRPFGVFTLGTTYFAPSNVTFTGDNYANADLSTEWKFSITLGGGAKIWLSDRVGIRLQGNLMLPMFWGGAGFSVGTGGSGFYVGGGTSMVQGNFTGGLIFALGD